MQADPAGLLERRRRLSRLAGRLCPICRMRGTLRPLLYDGRSLHCLAEHGWSNPDAAESEIATERRELSREETRRILAEKRAAEADDCQRLLLRLERAIGNWLPPEARKE